MKDLIRNTIYEEMLNNYDRLRIPELIGVHANSLFLALLHQAARDFFPPLIFRFDHNMMRLSGLTSYQFEFALETIDAVFFDNRMLISMAMRQASLHKWPSTSYIIEYHLLKNPDIQKATILSSDVLDRLNIKPLTADQKQKLRSLILILDNQRRPDSVPNMKLLRTIREHLIEINPNCTICGREGDRLHHKHYRSWREESFDDMILLCHRCHGFIHRRRAVVGSE